MPNGIGGPGLSPDRFNPWVVPGGLAEQPWWGLPEQVPPYVSSGGSMVPTTFELDPTGQGSRDPTDVTDIYHTIDEGAIFWPPPYQPQYNVDFTNLDALIAQLSGMFGPEGRAEYLTPFRTAGMGQIGRGVSAANRAIAGRLAASGIGDSGIATSAIGGTYAAGEQALAQLYSGLATAGLDYDRLQAGAISSAAGFEAQRQALGLQEFATQEEAGLARDRLEANIMLQQAQMAQQQSQWEEEQPNWYTEVLSTLFSAVAVSGLLGWQPFK